MRPALPLSSRLVRLAGGADSAGLTSLRHLALLEEAVSATEHDALLGCKYIGAPPAYLPSHP